MNDWNLNPLLLIGLLAVAVAYGLGLDRLWLLRGKYQVVTRQQARLFCLGMAVLALALISPLHGLGERLFSAHMVQHLALILIAAPLLVLGSPSVPLLLALDRPLRAWVVQRWAGARRTRQLLGWIASPLPAWILHTLIVWIWHLPSMYQAALTHESVHALEHLSLLLTAVLFWWVALRVRQPESYGAGGLYLVAAGMQCGLLGALLTFAGRPFYPVSPETTASFGLTPLQDQQLAGLLMWLPGGLVYFAAAGWRFLRLMGEWKDLDQPESEAQRLPGSLYPL